MELVRDFWSGALDLIYPPFCVACKQSSGSYLCPTCLEKIVLLTPPYCRKCGGLCPGNVYLCPDCLVREYSFDSSCSAGVYEGALQDAIHALKYDGHIALADTLSELMIRAFPATFLARHTDVVVAVPIHHSRLLERGFNQSEELARRLCKAVSLPIESRVLVCRRKTSHQARLPKESRAVNIEGAFEVRNAGAIQGKRVLVVDDVFTTGATMNEAARALRDAGALEVRGFTLARSI